MLEGSCDRGFDWPPFRGCRGGVACDTRLKCFGIQTATIALSSNHEILAQYPLRGQVLKKSPIAHGLDQGDHVLDRDIARHVVRRADDEAAVPTHLVHQPPYFVAHHLKCAVRQELLHADAVAIRQPAKRIRRPRLVLCQVVANEIIQVGRAVVVRQLLSRGRREVDLIGGAIGLDMPDGRSDPLAGGDVGRGVGRAE
jgi:hypothetical protein